MSQARQILRNIGALTAARGVTAVVTFVTTVYLARVLEPAGYGIINWGLAFLAYFNFAADLGLNVYAVREVARNKGRAHSLPSHILLLRLCSGLLTLGIYWGIVWSLDLEPLFKLTVAVLGLSLLAHSIELTWVYHGLQRLGVVAVRNVLTSVITLVGVVLLVRRPEHVVLAAAIMVASIVLPNMWLLVTYFREFGRPRFAVDLPLWWSMLLPALPIAGAQLLTTINTNLDQLMLGFMRTQTEVGWYAAAYRVVLAATIPWQIVLQAFLPSLAHGVGDASSMRHTGQPFAMTMFALGFPIAVGGYFLAADIVTVFGADYGEASGPLAMLMVGMAFMYARVLFGGILIAWDRQSRYMGILAVGAVLNIVLNALLIPQHGIMGAATATLATEIVVTVGTAAVFWPIGRTLFGQEVLRAALATGFGVLAPLWLGARMGLPLLVQLAVMVVVFGLSVFAFRVVPLEAVRRRLRSFSS